MINRRQEGQAALYVMVTLGVLALLVLVVFGGWQLGWWLSEESTNRRTGIANRSLARQSALSEEVLDKYRDARNIDVQLTEATPEQQTALRAQRVAIIDQLCDAYAQMTNRMTLSNNVETFVSEECP